MTARKIRTISNPILNPDMAKSLRLELDPHYMTSAHAAVKNTTAPQHVVRNVLAWQQQRSLSLM